MTMPVEVFNSLSALPKDPILRKQHLEDFMTKIHSSFSFMQASVASLNILFNHSERDGSIVCALIPICHFLHSTSFQNDPPPLFQDSLLDGEVSSTNGHSTPRRQPSGSPSPLGKVKPVNKFCNLTRLSQCTIQYVNYSK